MFRTSLFFILLTSISFAATETPVLKFQHSPTEMFTHEDVGVRFVVKPKEGTNVKSWSLVQIDQEGRKVRNLGPISDSGFVGDRKKDDGLFSRKVQFKERKSGQLQIVLIEAKGDLEKGDPVPKEWVLSETPLEITVNNRPSFVEALKSVWAKITN